jgi:dipeptide/tripeptide permease
MKIFINIFAAILIIIGIIFLSYHGFKYTTHAQLAEILPFDILSTETKVSSPFSPVIGGICIAIGVGLLVFNIMRR